MSAHSPGPWHLNAGRCGDDQCDGYTVRDADGEFVTHLDGSRYHDERADPEADANAARIVACVNACEGVADPADLRVQRDELLAALRALVRQCEYMGAPDSHEDMRAARAALAIVAGGGQ